MDKETRNKIQRATQAARSLLEQEYAEQLEGVFDIRLDGSIADQPGQHLDATERVQRAKLITAVEHLGGAGLTKAAAVSAYLREAAFTTLNRFVALKMLEARELVQECVSRGEQSAGFKEFTGLAPGLVQLPDHGYRAYIECIFDELSTEVKVLFERRDARALLWPKRAALDALLELLNASDLSTVWAEDETIGWVYQFFNGEDERKQMRAESQAPRNSREMAVRNQFFTPRYVVQFLTDNTLGRIWYEMRGTQTSLADSCEYMVCKPDETFAQRAKKDPRDLRVLDPACGSGHFLLYAFDLLLVAYEEAHADPESPKSEATGRTLAADYPTLEELRKAIPGLILAHNIHGVDIDARCAQIAQLALWMRAQRAYRDFQIGRAERPGIRKSNIVVAEPLVADDELVADFVAKLGDAELGRVFTALVDALKLAGDLGLLLKVETLVARSTPKGQSGNLFAPPEERIRSTLVRFVLEEGERSSTRKRLFAEDMVHGLGLLAIAEKNYDVVLMNPPFGLVPPRVQTYVADNYSGAHNDVYTSFVVRGRALAPHGLLGGITSRAFLVAPRMATFRRNTFVRSVKVLADFGDNVMDGAFVESCAFVVAGERDRSESPTLVAYDLRGIDDIGGRRAVQWPVPFRVEKDSLLALPASRILYALPTATQTLLKEAPHFEPNVGTAREGMKTFDNGRFLRLRWEVAAGAVSETQRWSFIAKGGSFSFYLGQFNVLVNWGDDGRELQAINIQKNGSTAQVRQASTYWRRSGVTYSGRSQKGFSARILPEGLIITGRGPAILPTSDVPAEYLLGWVNSRLIRSLVHLQASDAYFATGIIKSLPWVELNEDRRASLILGTTRALAHLLNVASSRERSSYFIGPFIAPTLNAGFDGTRKAIADAENKRENVMSEWDSAMDQVFGLDSASLAEDLGVPGVEPESDDSDDSDDDTPGEDRTLSFSQYVAHILSFGVGVAFGRWDVSAVGRRDEILASVSALDPLLATGLGALDTTDVGSTRILADDPGTENDLAAAVSDVLCRLFCEESEVPTQVALALGVPSVREYLAGNGGPSFFKAHLDHYSVSRRKAPIYWQLATPSASYSVWLYIHAFTKDTLFRVQNDYVAPKLAHEQRKLESLQAASQDGQTAADRKELAAQESHVEELRAFLDEVKRVAPLWNPNLDDGVIINFSLLWRLVPQHKPWQKELKSTWDALCTGKYDWAHLAMHLWPERVVPKCAKDRSLAIAHGLEEVFWVEGSDGKWTARKTPTTPISELIQERTSPAVQDALKRLLSAPAPAAGGAKKKAPRKKTARKSKAAKAKGDSV